MTSRYTAILGSYLDLAKELSGTLKAIDRKHMGFWDKDFTVTRTPPGWALSYIVKEKPIPENCRDRFYDELVSEDVEYRKTLEDAIRQHGVRWS